MLRIADTSSQQVPEVETNYTFPLDPFQKCAVAAIQARENVLVTAKTGSGKTLVGEYQIEYSLKRGGRCSTPPPSNRSPTKNSTISSNSILTRLGS